MTGDCHTARFADCIFDEGLFLTLGGENQPLDAKSREITWHAMGIHAHDPRTAETEREVQKIIDLQSLANQLPDHFSDLKTMTKSHVHACNAPEKVEIPKKNDGIPAPVQRPKRTRDPASQIPSTRGCQRKRIREIYYSLSPKYPKVKGEPVETWHKYGKFSARNSGLKLSHRGNTQQRCERTHRCGKSKGPCSHNGKFGRASVCAGCAP